MTFASTSPRRIDSVGSFVEPIRRQSATDSTVTAIKKLVDSLLLAGGSKFTVDELFEITLEDNPHYEKDSQDYYERELGQRKQIIVIKTKIESPAAAQAAGILANLTESFFIDVHYNG